MEPAEGETRVVFGAETAAVLRLAERDTRGAVAGLAALEGAWWADRSEGAAGRRPARVLRSFRYT